jgi:hypothetical protein
MRVEKLMGSRRGGMFNSWLKNAEGKAEVILSSMETLEDVDPADGPGARRGLPPLGARICPDPRGWNMAPGVGRQRLCSKQHIQKQAR